MNMSRSCFLPGSASTANGGARPDVLARRIAAGRAVTLDGSSLTCADVDRVARLAAPVQLSTEPAVRERVTRARDTVAAAVAAGATVYGVTTGFGGMADTAIPPDLAGQLQQGLLAFLHAGAGDPLPERDVRAAMLIRANSHLRGASGVRWELIERSAVLLRAGVTPVVRDLGSIGASGDLVPLAAIARAVIGSARQPVVTSGGTVTTAREALSALGLPPLSLQAKEGLALVNGTAVSTARATLCVLDAIDYLDVVTAFHGLAVHALGASSEPYAAFTHEHKPHAGQARIAERMRRLTDGAGASGSQLAERLASGKLGQDRYALRCIPQYLGPVADCLDRACDQLEVEMNSTTDNPLVDPADGRFFHGGNFLAEYVATAMDSLRAHLALACKHVDVQVATLMAPEHSSGLPPSLVGNTALSVNMGLKGLQILGNSIMPLVTYFAAPIADRFPTHAEQFNQNINSQSYGAARLAREQIELARRHLAVALVAVTQAVELKAQRAHGTHDARALLSPPAASIYTTIKDVLGSPVTPGRPTVWDDTDQPLEAFVDRVFADLAACGRIADACKLN
jgi:phenylalanine ammonia-lyase